MYVQALHLSECAKVLAAQHLRSHPCQARNRSRRRVQEQCMQPPQRTDASAKSNSESSPVSRHHQAPVSCPTTNGHFPISSPPRFPALSHLPSSPSTEIPHPLILHADPAANGRQCLIPERLPAFVRLHARPGAAPARMCLQPLKRRHGVVPSTNCTTSPPKSLHSEQKKKPPSHEKGNSERHDLHSAINRKFSLGCSIEYCWCF